MEALGVHRLSKSYGDDVKALSDVSFSLDAGRFGVILGPSGAGKTTLLNIIAGLVHPDEGHVSIADHDMTGVDPEHRDVAMVFENYALYPHMTVRQNLEFPLKAPVRAGELSSAEIAERVAQVVATMGMSHLLDRLPSQLSGGQRQRVSLGRALVRRPQLLLLDEPITHLDAKLRHQMRTELKRLQRDLGTTTLYATPDQGDALALADVVVVMHGGRVWQVDTPDAVYHAPQNVRVAESLGDPRMNLLTGRRTASGVNVLGLHFSRANNDRVNVHSGDVVVGIRPQDITLYRHPEPGSGPGRVIFRQTLGYSDVLFVEIADTVVRVLGNGFRELQTGDGVWLRPEPARLHLFDPPTGLAIEGELQRVSR